MLREQKEYEPAKDVLEEALAKHPTERIWMQAAQLRRETGDLQGALKVVNAALETEFKTFHKLWIIKAQILEQLGLTEEAQQTYASALKVEGVRRETTVWLLAAEFEERQEMFTRARTILEKVRFKMPTDPSVWLASIRLERTCDNEKVAQQLLARALQVCPESGPLQTLAIEMEPQAQTRMRKAIDAVKQVKDDPSIFVAIGKVFWVEKKTTKARKWLTRATELDPDNGDTWLHLLKFEAEAGD